MRIALVNDMPMALEALRRVVASVPGYEVAWTALDGEAAVHLCAQDVPDLILMDLVMPRMDGVEATRRIMLQSPCAILVVTATVGGRAGQVFEAMGHGALDAVDTPVLGRDGRGDGGEPLRAKIAMLERLIRKPRPSTLAGSFGPAGGGGGGRTPLVGLGASTGGPAALVTVLNGIPLDTQASIVVVQHVDEHFAPGLAGWLTAQSGRSVVVIRPSDRPRAGTVHLAASNDHLVLCRDGTFDYVHEPADVAFRPSVDICFESLAAHWHGPLAAAVLTGMGNDGARGLLALRRVGGHTIAQDQATSLVYGMPKAAVAAGAAIEVLPIDRIGSAIAAALQHAGDRGQEQQENVGR